MRHAAFQCDGIVFCASGRLAACTGVTAFPVLDYFSGAFEGRNFADASDILAVPFYAKLEVFIWIKTLCVDNKLCHSFLLSLKKAALVLRLELSSKLLNLDHYKLCRFQRCKSYKDIYDSIVNVGLRGGFTVALYKVGLIRGLSLKGSLTEIVVHKCANVQTDRRP